MRKNFILKPVTAVIAVTLHAVCAVFVQASAQLKPSPLLHMEFDGSIENSGEFGVTPSLIAAGGEVYKGSPSFAEGKFGQALSLTGEYAIEIPFDLSRYTYPQTTVTAWVYSERGRKQGQVPLVSNGGFLWLNLYGHEVHLNCGSRCFVRQRGDATPNGRWVFVAGVYDGIDNKMALYVDQRVEESAMDFSGAVDDERSVWVGTRRARNRTLDGQVRIDDVRIYDEALSEDSIRNLYLEGVQVVRKKPGRTTPKNTGGVAEQEELAQTQEMSSDQTADTAGTGQMDTTSSGPLLESPDPVEKPDGISGPSNTASEELQGAVDDAKDEAPRVLTAPEEFETTVPIETLPPTEDTEPAQPQEDSGSSSAGGEKSGDSGPRWYIDASESATSDLAGVRGDVIRNLELDPFQPLQSIGWGITTFTPCRLKINDGRGLAWQMEAGTCNGSQDTQRSASLDKGYITGLHFESKRTRAAIDALGVVGYELDRDGRLIAEEADHTANPNFGLGGVFQSSGSSTQCPAGYLANGVVGHFKRRQNGATAIVGLQLICAKLKNAAPWELPR